MRAARGSVWAVVALACAAAGQGCGSHSHGGAQTGAGGSGSAGGAASTADAGAVATTSAAEDAGMAAPQGGGEQARELFTAGQQAFVSGDLHAAAQDWEQVYRLAPSPGMAYNLARVYERMGETDQGVHYYQVFLQSNPADADRTDAQRGIAALQTLAQRRQSGIMQAPASDSELNAEARSWFQRGITAYSRHRFSEALIDFQQVYQYVQTATVYYNLAATYAQLARAASTPVAQRRQNFQDAIANYREYMQTLAANAPDRAEIQTEITRLQTEQRSLADLH